MTRLIVLVSLVLIGGTLVAQQRGPKGATVSTSTTTTGGASTRPVTRKTVLTLEREAAVMTFVRQHHPALERLLSHLKKREPNAYQRAARDLYRTSERLANTMERDEERYQLELELWKTKSRAQLISAQIKVRPENEALRKKLRTLLNKQVNQRLAMLQQQRERVQNRLKNIDKQIAKVKSDQSQSVERQMRYLTRTKKRRGEKKEGNGKSARRKTNPASKKPNSKKGKEVSTQRKDK